jgi:hypothetical protein
MEGEVEDAEIVVVAKVEGQPVVDADRRERRRWVVSESWWKFAFGVAPEVDGCSIKRRGQAAVRSVPGPGFASHRSCAW